MSFLQNKKVLVTGVVSKRSIAYGIAKACVREGAEIALTYQSERFKDRIEKIAADDFNNAIAIECDVASDEQINASIAKLEEHWDRLDGLVHSIAYAPQSAIEGDFLDGLSREAFQQAHDISAYSYPALVKSARHLLLKSEQASVLALSYLGAVKTMPNYNTMGVAKASLESATRYMAYCLGPQGIRVNAVSAGPIKTLAASGIGSFSKLLTYNAHHSLLRRNITIDEVGNAAAFLLSNLSSGITGEIMYVDAGINTTALGNQEPLV